MPRFTTTDGVSLYFTDEGSGLPVLCLSGLTRNGTDFDYVAPLLSGYRMIRLDYRGRGQSDYADPTSYTTQREGMDALELLDHLGIDAVAVLGTSRGGMIAMGLAAMVPQRLLGIALNDIGPELDMGGLDFILTYLGRKPAYATLAEAAAARPALMPGFKNVPMARWEDEVAKFYFETKDGLDIPYDPKLRHGVEAMAGQTLPDLWPFFDAMAGKPLAIVWGMNSDLLNVDCVDEMARRRPDAHVARVPDRGHVPFLDEAEAQAVLKAWLKDIA